MTGEPAGDAGILWVEPVRPILEPAQATTDVASPPPPTPPPPFIDPVESGLLAVLGDVVKDATDSMEVPERMRKVPEDMYKRYVGYLGHGKLKI